MAAQVDAVGLIKVYGIIEILDLFKFPFRLMDGYCLIS